MIQTRAEILLNHEIAPGHFKMVLLLSGFKGVVKAGQFFHIRAGSDYDPLLRRPISVHRIGSRPDMVELLYKIVGKGTHLMSRRSKGTYLDLIGPLGNGFNIPRGESNFILVAGGMGVAPLVALADELVQLRKRSITVVLGAKTKSLIICKKEFEEIKAKVTVVTEDASAGEKGLATDILEDMIKHFDLRKTGSRLISKDAAHITIGDYRPEVALYACGPVAMLRQMAKVARQHRIHAQVSMEEAMGCGVGACLGCVVKTKEGYKRVCKDGPVFDLEDIVWD